MFRKLDQWLLTRHPLLWNMRVHWIFPVIIIMHIVFYVSGYLTSITIGSLDHYYNIGRGEVVNAMASLLAVLLMVLWLVFYFRNNAFKSFYPLKKGRLFAEYLVLALIIGGVSTFALSWHKGLRDHVRVLTKDVDLKKEAETVNLAMHFIPFSKEDFSIHGCCDTLLKYKDSSDYYARRAIAEDTLPQHNSYLYYCNQEITGSDQVQLRDKYEINTIANRWLMQHKQDSVRWAIDEYLKLCNKYEAGCRFSAAEAVKECFETPDFRVGYYVADRSYDERDVYLEKGDVTASLQWVDNVREPYWNYETTMVFLYLALCGALLILSFRLTKLRTWFIAAIGSGLWAMFFGLMAGLTHGDETFIIPLFLILAVVFFFGAAWNILKKDGKLMSGMMLLWFTWALPSLVPLFIAFLMRAVFRANRYVYDQAGNGEDMGPDPAYSWIQDHWGLINASNLLLVILMVAFVLIPLARKWQANPEE